MNPRIPIEGRIQTAESVFQSRQRLCLQGTRVEGGCAQYCVEGGKLISRADPGTGTPRSDNPPNPTGTMTHADVRRTLQTMDRCLKEHGGLSYYKSPNLVAVPGGKGSSASPGQPQGRLPASEGANLYYDPDALATMLDPYATKPRTAYWRTFLLARPLAEHTIRLWEAHYPQLRLSDRERVLEQDMLQGWLHGCLVRASLVPSRNTRAIYGDYLRRHEPNDRQGRPYNIAVRESSFAAGYTTSSLSLTAELDSDRFGGEDGRQRPTR